MWEFLIDWYYSLQHYHFFLRLFHKIWYADKKKKYQDKPVLLNDWLIKLIQIPFMLSSHQCYSCAYYEHALSAVFESWFAWFKYLLFKFLSASFPKPCYFDSNLNFSRSLCSPSHFCMKQAMPIDIYEECSKSIDTETLFTKKVVNYEWSINFLQNSPLGIQHIYSRAQMAEAVEYASCISNEYPGYDTKPFNGEALILELYGMWSILSLPLLPGPLSRSGSTFLGFIYWSNRTV